MADTECIEPARLPSRAPVSWEKSGQDQPTWIEPLPTPAPSGDLEPVPGDMIAGKFRVVERLGSGAMGIVLRAVDEELGRDVALKIVRRHRSDEEFVRKRFLAEAKALARVRHRNVIQIYAHTRWEDRSVLVMEYMPCTSLAGWLTRHGGRPAPLNFIADSLDALCAGLGAIHDAGSIHRDVKPDNVLIAANGRVAITDLGLARFVEDRETPWIGGTPAYMSPSQLRGGDEVPEPTHHDDLWSLAVVAYELLTGHKPFGGGSPAHVRASQNNGSHLQPKHLRRDLPPACNDLFMRLFARDGARRPQSATELRAAFQGLFEGMQTTRHRRVVLADDDPDFLRWLKSVVSDLLPGAEVLAFERASNAYKAAVQEGTALVITDLDMPAVDGLGFTQQLRADVRTRAVPILVLTGSGGADDWRSLSSSGADAFLVKPAHIGVLAATMERLLRDSVSSDGALAGPQ